MNKNNCKIEINKEKNENNKNNIIIEKEYGNEKLEDNNNIEIMKNKNENKENYISN